MIRDFGKTAAQWGAGRLGSLLARALPGCDGTFAILVYHRCTPHVRGVPRPSINIRPERFRQQLLGLKRRAFTAWPLERVIAWCRRGQPIPEKTFVLTFDDGFESVYRHAWPVLRELQMPATIFLNTAFLDRPAPFPFDRWARRHRKQVPAEAYRPLSSQQCLELLNDGLITFGAHTHSHADFRGRPRDLQRDLNTCLNELRSRFALPKIPFAFPFGKSRLGYVDETLLQVARRAKVTCALTTDGRVIRPGEDPIGWPRLNVYDFDTAGAVAAKCAGWCDWAFRFHARLPTRLIRPITPSTQPSAQC